MSLDAPENILFDDYGKNPNELRPNWEVVEYASTYLVEIFTDINAPDSSRIASEIVTPSKATIGNLPGGAMVFVRVLA